MKNEDEILLPLSWCSLVAFQIHNYITTSIATLNSKVYFYFLTAFNLTLYVTKHEQQKCDREKRLPTKGLAKNWLTQRSINFSFGYSAKVIGWTL